MMVQKSVKCMLFILGLVSVASVAAHTYKSHKVQIILAPMSQLLSPMYSFWALNTVAGGISYDFSAVRTIGSSVIATGLIYPKGTVNKYQADYTVDHHGNPLNPANSLGGWVAEEAIVTEYDLVSNFPANGTRLSVDNWSFFFNDSEDQDNLYAVGRVKASVLGESNGSIVQYGKLDVNGGTGEFKEESSRPRMVDANFYLSTAGNMLIKVKFDKEIEVKY